MKTPVEVLLDRVDEMQKEYERVIMIKPDPSEKMFINYQKGDLNKISRTINEFNNAISKLL